MAQFPGQTPEAVPLLTFLSELGATELCMVWLVENAYRKVCVSLRIQAWLFFDRSPGNCASWPLSCICKYQIRASLFFPEKIDHLYIDFSDFIFLLIIQQLHVKYHHYQFCLHLNFFKRSMLQHLLSCPKMPHQRDLLLIKLITLENSWSSTFKVWI